MVASFSVCGRTKFYLYLLSATNTLYNLQTALRAYNTFNDQNMARRATDAFPTQDDACLGRENFAVKLNEYSFAFLSVS